MFVNTAVAECLAPPAKKLYLDGTVGLEEAIQLSIAYSLSSIAEDGITISYDPYSDTSIPVVVHSIDEDGEPVEPLRVKVVPTE